MRRMSRFWLLAGALAIYATQAAARLGGGEHFDSGSGSGSSSSGGDGAIDFVFQLLWWLLWEHPKFGIPLLLCVIAYFLLFRPQAGDASTRKAVDRAEAKRRTQVNPALIASWVSALRSKDPQFDPEQLLERIRREFLELQEAWFRRDLEAVRRYLSDATYQRLKTQLQLLDALGVRDALADPRVLDAQIIRLEQGEAFDTVHVRVTAQVRDGEAPASASDNEARAIARRQAAEQFNEVWSFVRRPDTQTKSGQDVSQGVCPSCGAAFAGGATNTCEFCGAIVNSGSYDWVLAEITQGSQYLPQPAEPEGLAQLRETDPACAVEVIEDRASLLFWKWVEAQSAGDASRLAKVAAPEFLTGIEQMLVALAAQGRRKWFVDCAVGAVNVLQFSRQDGRDIAAVEIRWSAKIALAEGAGRPPAAASQPQRDVLLLERRHGAQSAASGMATNRCPSCAAPLSDNGQPTCEFCGSVLSSGDGDWVLRDFCRWENWRARARMSQALPDSGEIQEMPEADERTRLIHLLVAVARADGVVDRQERALLRMAADRWGVPWADIELALEMSADAWSAVGVAKGSPEGEVLLRGLIQLMRADGKIDAKEKKLLRTAALHLGLRDRLAELL